MTSEEAHLTETNMNIDTNWIDKQYSIERVEASNSFSVALIAWLVKQDAYKFIVTKYLFTTPEISNSYSNCIFYS